MTDRTYCRICEAACGLLVERGGDGAPVRLVPDRDHPVSRGFSCAKGTRFLDVARRDGRLRTPLRRGADGALAPIDWTEAIGEAAAALNRIRQRHGPHAVGVYFGNPLAFNALGTVALVAFLEALGTRNAYSAGSQDCNNKFAGGELVHGSALVHPLPDLEHCELALLLGTNPAVSLSSFVHLDGGGYAFDRLVRRGAEVIWIDPRRTESAARWGVHQPIRPGTDVFLLLALLHELRDRAREDDRVVGLERMLALAASFPAERAAALTGIDAGRIRDLAGRIRRARGTALHQSVGVNQGPFGTLAYVALQALSHVSGNLDRRGGNVFNPLAPAAGRLLRALEVGTEKRRSRVGDFASVLDTLPGAILADEILTPGAERIRALVVVAGDPLVSIPGGERLREALRALDLLVTVDLFESHTGREADLLLPATSWLERWDFATTTVAFQTAPLVQMARPVLEPPGEARTEARILGDLMGAMGIGGPLARRWARVPWDRFLPAFGRGVPVPAPRPGRYLGRSLHPDGRLRFWGDALDVEAQRLESFAADAPDLDDAFRLLCRRRKLGHNAWLHGGQIRARTEDEAWLAPADLIRLGIEDGGRIEIATEAGAIVVRARGNAGVAPRTVVVPHGLPSVNVNAIIPSGATAVERVSGQHRMTGIPARVRARSR